MVLRSSLIGLMLMFAASGITAEESLVILPESFRLMYPGAEQGLVLEARNEDGSYVGEIANDVIWKSSDPKIIAVENNRVRAIANGEAVVTANWQGTIAEAKVVVSGVTDELEWD